MIICENNTVFAKSDFWSKTRQPAPVSPTLPDVSDLFVRVVCHHNDGHECFKCFISGFKFPLLTKTMPNRVLSERPSERTKE